jgi:hypothetical protein
MLIRKIAEIYLRVLTPALAWDALERRVKYTTYALTYTRVRCFPLNTRPAIFQLLCEFNPASKWCYVVCRHPDESLLRRREKQAAVAMHPRINKPPARLIRSL